MKVDLVDGTYELFRHHYGLPSAVREKGSRTAATRGVLMSVLAMLEGDATHVGVATDHVIESFRNDLWPGYKTSAGMPEEILAQFTLLEEALAALGVAVWPMVELEADDALASAAVIAAADPTVEQVRIHTVDKDLAQCVEGDRVVQVNVRKRQTLDEQAVRARYGVLPESIPDWLALVGDSADGYPGLPGWGAKSAAAVLRRYRHIEDVPRRFERWEVTVSGARRLATTLAERFEDALLFRTLATLRRDAELFTTAEELRWTGPEPGLGAVGERLDAPRLLERAETLAAARFE